jgi:hypothetical protein
VDHLPWKSKIRPSIYSKRIQYPRPGFGFEAGFLIQARVAWNDARRSDCFSVQLHYRRDCRQEFVDEFPESFISPPRKTGGNYVYKGCCSKHLRLLATLAMS